MQSLQSRTNNSDSMTELFIFGRAEKHKCKLLRRAAIPLTATNFDRIDPKQLILVTANDMQELLASDQLSSTEVKRSCCFVFELSIFEVKSHSHFCG